MKSTNPTRNPYLSLQAKHTTMNLFLIVLGLSVVLLALGLLGMAFNIVFLKKRFPETSVGHNKNLRKLGIKCEKCEEMKRCRPKNNKQQESKNAQLPDFGQILDMGKL